MAEGHCCFSRASQACTATVSTGACSWCLQILAPPAACAGYHGTSGALRPWRPQRRSGEWPKQAGHVGTAVGAAAPENEASLREEAMGWGLRPHSSREAPVAMPPLSPPPRVSIPLSMLDPPHQYRIHRRKSFDASDTLALPRVSSHMGPGWGWAWGCLLSGSSPQMEPEVQRGLGTVPRPHSEAGLRFSSSGWPHPSPVLLLWGRWGTLPTPWCSGYVSACTLA